MVALPCAGVALRGAIYVLMPIGAVLILLGALVGEPEQGPRHLRTALLSPAGMTALFLTFWAGLSLLWTPFLAQAGQRFAQIVGTTFLVALVAAYLPTRTKAFDLYLLPVGAALSAIAMLALAWRGPDWFLGAAEFDESLFQRSMITLIVLVWPALGALALREHWILAAGLALLAAAVALAGFAQIGLAAMGAAAFTFALAMPQAGRVARRLGFFFAGLVLLAPALPLIYGAILNLTRHEAGPASQSMLIWRDIVISEWPRLITGHGLRYRRSGRQPRLPAGIDAAKPFVRRSGTISASSARRPLLFSPRASSCWRAGIPAAVGAGGAGRDGRHPHAVHFRGRHSANLVGDADRLRRHRLRRPDQGNLSDAASGRAAYRRGVRYRGRRSGREPAAGRRGCGFLRRARRWAAKAARRSCGGGASGFNIVS